MALTVSMQLWDAPRFYDSCHIVAQVGPSAVAVQGFSVLARTEQRLGVVTHTAGFHTLGHIHCELENRHTFTSAIPGLSSV